jgi:hypothetical protein
MCGNAAEFAAENESEVFVGVFGPYVLSERTSAGSHIAAGGKTVDGTGQAA